MSRILRRPMFRGGKVDSYGTGIASGLASGGRVGYDNGGQILQRARSRIRGPQDFPLNTTFGSMFNADLGSPIKTRSRIRGPQDFLKGSSIEDAEGLLADASTTGATNDGQEFFGNVEFGLEDDIREQAPKLGVGSDFDKDMENYLTDNIEISPGLEALRKANIRDANKTRIEDLTTEREVEKVDIKDDEPEVTMTDLEKALGLDKAKRRDLGDMLGRASAAFLGAGDVREGLAEFMAAEAKAGPSRTERIKSIAGLEEYKAKKAKELYETKLTAQLKQKAGTKGSLQKDIEYLGTLSGADRTAALGKLGYKAPSLSAAIKELKITGQAPDAATIINLAELYIGPDFKGVVDVTEELSTKPAGTYVTTDGTALVIIDEQGKPRLQKL